MNPSRIVRAVRDHSTSMSDKDVHSKSARPTILEHPTVTVSEVRLAELYGCLANPGSDGFEGVRNRAELLAHIRSAPDHTSKRTPSSTSKRSISAQTMVNDTPKSVTQFVPRVM